MKNSMSNANIDIIACSKCRAVKEKTAFSFRNKSKNNCYRNCDKQCKECIQELIPLKHGPYDEIYFAGLEMLDKS